ncbi:MAG: hypothetical protein RL150_425 [Candidatus Parcubacteria bacterium]
MSFAAAACIVSGVALVAMVSLRLFERTIGRDIVPARARDAADARVVRFIAVGRRAARRARAAAMHELHNVPVFILHALVVVWAWALKQTLKAVNAAQRKSNGQMKDTVAAHLESVRAYEKQLRL